jgi:PAS domain S-box-containing protein
MPCGLGAGGPVKRKDEIGSGREFPTGEAALERAERFGNLLTLSYEPMLAWRLDGPIEFWNAGAERLYGFAQDEAVGRTSHALLRTEFPIDFADLRSQLRDRRNWSGELRHTCKDGSKVVVESHMRLFNDSLVLEANRDITKRIEIEVSLRESEQRLRWLASIVESSDDAIVSKNLDGIITSWNRGAERVFGYSAGEAIGQPITLVIPENRQSEEREILTRIRRGERIDHFETVRQGKHGSLIAVSLTVSPVKDGNGRIVGASKIARDITEQKRNQGADHDPGAGGRAPQQEFACERAGSGQPFSVGLARGSQTDHRRAHPGACECLLTFRGDALDRCRVIGDRDTGTGSVFRGAREAGVHRRTANPAGTRRRAGNSSNVARIGDQCREVRLLVHSQRPSPPGMVARG